MKVYVIIPAAGLGTRMAPGSPKSPSKQFAEIHGAPILVHLVRRTRARKIEFPALTFVRQVPQRTIRRRTFRNLLLLILRCLALLLIVIAVAPWLPLLAAVLVPAWVVVRRQRRLAAVAVTPMEVVAAEGRPPDQPSREGHP